MPMDKKKRTKLERVKEKIDILYYDHKEDCPKLKKGVKELHTFIHTYPIHKFTTPEKVFFQEVLGYENRTEVLGKKLGFISRENYEKNKKIIEKLRKEANIEELKKYLEK